MKNFFFLFVLALGALVSLPSCGTDDPCKDVDCGANGTCFEGACVCNQGYEGASCELTWASKFAGSYGGKDVCVSADPDLNGTFTLKDTEPVVIIEKSVDGIQIDNIGGWQNSFTTTVKKVAATDDTATSFDINFTDSSSRVFLGSATYNATTKVISGTYKVTFPDGSFADCTITYTKK